jgi:glycosyltransferase involved in cell wall biosynthesis
MNILVVQESNWLTRNPHQQHHLMERLAARGHSVRVIDYDVDWKKKNEDGISSPRTEYAEVNKIIPGISIRVIRPLSIRIPILEYPVLLITHRKEILRQIREFKPDIIIGFGILNAWIAARLARTHKIPFVYYWIDALDTLIPEKLFQTLGRTFAQQTLRNSALVISINKRLRDYVIALGAVPESATVIGAGIDLERFNPAVDGSAIRSRYALGNDDIVLFFMGWLYHFSGLKEVALELARSPDRYRNLKILVVGDGDALSDLQKIRDTYQLGDNLILTGKQSYEKIPEFIAASNICILPADPKEKIMQDIVPIKMYEYMAIGKPVISTKLPGVMREFGLENGVLYVDSPEMVPEAAYAISTNGTIKNQSNSARLYVQNLDWRMITDTFEEALFTTRKKYGHRN